MWRSPMSNIHVTKFNVQCVMLTCRHPMLMSRYPVLMSRYPMLVDVLRIYNIVHTRWCDGYKPSYLSLCYVKVHGYSSTGSLSLRPSLAALVQVIYWRPCANMYGKRVRFWLQQARQRYISGRNLIYPYIHRLLTVWLIIYGISLRILTMVRINWT